MNAKLDHLFRFRDNEKFKVFTKYFTYFVLLYALVILGLVCGFKKDALGKGWAFSVIPLLLTASFFRKNDYMFILAEFITVIADIFLMLLRKQAIGFPIYILVQFAYAVYFFFRDANRKRQIIITIVRPVAMGLGVLALFLFGKKLFNLTNSFGVIYFVNIIINVICACIFKDPILIVGFAIFLISDSFIFIDKLTKSIASIQNILAAFNFVHFFYLISQSILIFNKYNNYYFAVNTTKTTSIEK